VWFRQVVVTRSSRLTPQLGQIYWSFAQLGSVIVARFLTGIPSGRKVWAGLVLETKQSFLAEERLLQLPVRAGHALLDRCPHRLPQVTTSELRIELELLEPKGPGLEIRYWYCVDGQILGRPEAACLLEAALAGTEALLRYEDSRRDLVLASKERDALYTELYLGLLVDFDIGVDPGKHWQRYARFQVLPANASCFEGWNAFLVESDTHARLLWAPPGRDARPCEARLPLGTFDAALHAFRRELQDQQRARSSVPPVSGERLTGPARETG
jgi:hypothetical protein